MECLLLIIGLLYLGIIGKCSLTLTQNGDRCDQFHIEKPYPIPCVRRGSLTQRDVCNEGRVTEGERSVTVTLDKNDTDDTLKLAIKWKYTYNTTFGSDLDGFILKVFVTSLWEKSLVYCRLLTPTEAAVAVMERRNEYVFNCLKLVNASLPTVSVEVTAIPKSVWSHSKPLCVDIVTMTTLAYLCEKFEHFKIRYWINGVKVDVRLFEYPTEEDYNFTLKRDNGVVFLTQNVHCTTKVCQHEFTVAEGDQYFIQVKPNCNGCYYCTTFESERFHVAMPMALSEVNEADQNSDDDLLAFIIAAAILGVTVIVFMVIACYKWRQRICYRNSQTSSNIDGSSHSSQSRRSDMLSSHILRNASNEEPDQFVHPDEISSLGSKALSQAMSDINSRYENNQWLQTTPDHHSCTELDSCSLEGILV